MYVISLLKACSGPQWPSLKGVITKLLLTNVNILISTDVESPNITCPGDIVVSTTYITWPDLGAIDKIDKMPSVSCDHSTNYTFPVGATTVSCTATDDAGNTATCTFNVTVGMYSVECTYCTPKFNMICKFFLSCKPSLLM